MSVPAIKARRAASNRAIGAGDVAGFGFVLSENVSVAFAQGTLITGRAAVMAALAAQFDAAPQTRYIRTPKSIKVARDGQQAFEEGSWRGCWPGDAAMVEGGGRYGAAWRLADGDWFIVAEIFITL